MRASDLRPAAARCPVVVLVSAFAVLACLGAGVAAQSPVDAGEAAREAVGSAAGSVDSSHADELLICLAYSAAVAALCFGTAIAWALRQPAGTHRSAAALTGAAAVSIVLFWVVLYATWPAIAYRARNLFGLAVTLQVVAHALLGFLLWGWLGKRSERMRAPMARSVEMAASTPGEPSNAAVPPPAPETQRSEAPPPPQQQRALFISYRRVDSSDVTGRIYDRLVASHGRDRVFKDVDSIPLGTDFRRHVAALIERSDCVLAVIGRQWLDVTDSAGRRRLDDPADLVRIEIEAALTRGVPVIPLLVQGALMPDPQALPEALRPLAFRNGMAVRADPDFHRDLDRLDEQLRLLAGAGPR